MTKTAFSKSRPVSCKLEMKKYKARRRRKASKKKARLLALKKMQKLFVIDKERKISEDECDFDFDNSGRPLCSSSSDDSDGPQGSNE